MGVERLLMFGKRWASGKPLGSSLEIFDQVMCGKNLWCRWQNLKRKSVMHFVFTSYKNFEKVEMKKLHKWLETCLKASKKPWN